MTSAEPPCRRCRRSPTSSARSALPARRSGRRQSRHRQARRVYDNRPGQGRLLGGQVDIKAGRGRLVLYAEGKRDEALKAMGRRRCRGYREASVTGRKPAREFYGVMLLEAACRKRRGFRSDAKKGNRLDAYVSRTGRRRPVIPPRRANTTARSRHRRRRRQTRTDERSARSWQRNRERPADCRARGIGGSARGNRWT